MKNLIVAGVAVGAAGLLAVSIVAPFSLLSARAQDSAPAERAATANPPAHAVEGQPAYDVGIPAKAEARVFFANLADGATVTSPVTVEFGMLGLTVQPAGEVNEGRGHHHLLIDTPVSELDLAQPLPASEQVIHYGDGSTRATLELAPGRHTLQLLAADGNHVPHDPPVMSAPIAITVVESLPAPTPILAGK
jgi:hypothetical protein